MTPAGTRPKRLRTYRKSGFHALVRAASRNGLSALDRRSTLARALKRWKTQVATDLGGNLSAQQQALLEVAAVDMAIVAVADAWLKEHAGEVVNKRRREFVPLVNERLRVVQHLADLLGRLGLERRVPEAPTLASHLASRPAAGPTRLRAIPARPSVAQETPKATPSSEPPAAGAREDEGQA